MENLDPLNALLKAPSKDAVDQVFNLAFYHGRNILLKTSRYYLFTLFQNMFNNFFFSSISEALPTQIIKKTEELLQISSSEAIQVCFFQFFFFLSLIYTLFFILSFFFII